MRPTHHPPSKNKQQKKTYPTSYLYKFILPAFLPSSHHCDLFTTMQNASVLSTRTSRPYAPPASAESTLVRQCYHRLLFPTSDDYESSSHTLRHAKEKMQAVKCHQHNPNIDSAKHRRSSKPRHRNRHEEPHRSPKQDATQKINKQLTRVNRRAKTAQGYAIKFIQEMRPTRPDHEAKTEE